MLAEFESKVADFIKAHALLRPADKILLAVSGGADSTVLLHLMCALKAMGVVKTELICAHLNHQLRGSEADEDEDFVIRQAGGLNVPVITRRFDVRSFADKNKLSIETAARELRIKNLMDIAKANGCDLIATGNQKNDNAETILQRLSRGTGFRGLGGIWPRRTFNGGIEFIRPLLCVTRAEIVDYLSQKSIKWRTDRTNIECSYRRNYIRHRLLPALQKQCSDSAVEELSELTCATRKFYSLVYNCADETWPKLANCSDEKVMLDLRMLSTEPPAVKVELIRRSLAAVGCGERDLAQKHYERILQLAERNVSNNGLDLPGGFAAWREYNNLTFARVERISGPERQIGESAKVEVPGRTRFGDYLIKATVLEPNGCDIEKFKEQKSESVEWFDLDRIKPPLVARFRKDGDKFWPLGLASQKKVGKFLTAAKVPQDVRRKVLVVTDSEKIIWLWPIRISEQARITPNIRKILQLQITEAPNT